MRAAGEFQERNGSGKHNRAGKAVRTRVAAGRAMVPVVGFAGSVIPVHTAIQTEVR